MVMKPTFKKLQVNDLGNLEDLVAENIEGIEPGLRVVDSRVCLGHAAIDLIALDASESLVLIALDFLADEGLLLRGMDAYSWSLEYHDTLRRLYPMANVSSTRPPRLLFVVERLSDAFVRRIKQLSFLEIDCLEFRHLEVNGASAVYFDLVARLRRAAPVEPASTGEAVATVPVRTPKRRFTELPAVAPAWPRAGEPRGVQPSAATATTLEPAPFAPERSAIAAKAWAATEHSGSVEARMVELFGRPSTVEMPSAAGMPTETYAADETPEMADAEAADADVVAEEPALQLESVDATARQEPRQAASAAARVTASPEWEALLHQLGAAMPASTREAEFTGHAADAAAEAPVEADATANEAGARLRQATQGGSGLADPDTFADPVEPPVPAAVDAAVPTQTQPAWTKPSTDKVVQPITARTYFFSQAAKSTTPAEAPEPTPAVAPAAAAAAVAPDTAAPAQRFAAPAQQTSAPVHPRPAAPAWPPVAQASQTASPAPQAVAMAATKMDAAKPAEPDTSRPGLEALSFPKDGLSRQWLEFLNQLGGAK
jgi:hypothetical protein